eukprot:12114096-Alexandrium_andersonii.AAC.1
MPDHAAHSWPGQQLDHRRLLPRARRGRMPAQEVSPPFQLRLAQLSDELQMRPCPPRTVAHLDRAHAGVAH